MLSSDYASAAGTPDGKLAIVYMPSIRTIRFNMSKFSGTMSAQCTDPANGTFTAASGSPFPNSGTHDFTPFGNNSAGDGDWALVLDGSPPRCKSPPPRCRKGPRARLFQPDRGNRRITALLVVARAQFAAAAARIRVPAGLLSGTPATNGIFNPTVQVTDSTNAVATQSLAAASGPPTTSAPTIPSGVTATAVSSGQINVSWTASTDNVGVTGYLVERSQGTGSTVFAQVGTPTGVTFNDTGLSAGTVYNYRVRAADAAGNLSGYSSVAGATTFAAATAVPVAAYALGEGAGSTTADASGNGLTGTISGATWTTGGRYGDALSFNGATSYVNLGNPAPLQLTGSMTVEAWVMATGTPADDGQIVSKSNGSGWQFKTSPDTGVRTFAVGVTPNGAAIVQRYSKTVVALNTWYPVAGFTTPARKRWMFTSTASWMTASCPERFPRPSSTRA